MKEYEKVATDQVVLLSVVFILVNILFFLLLIGQADRIWAKRESQNKELS